MKICDVPIPEKIAAVIKENNFPASREELFEFYPVRAKFNSKYNNYTGQFYVCNYIETLRYLSEKNDLERNTVREIFSRNLGRNMAKFSIPENHDASKDTSSDSTPSDDTDSTQNTLISRPEDTPSDADIAENSDCIVDDTGTDTSDESPPLIGMRDFGSFDEVAEEADEDEDYEVKEEEEIPADISRKKSFNMPLVLLFSIIAVMGAVVAVILFYDSEEKEQDNMEATKEEYRKRFKDRKISKEERKRKLNLQEQNKKESMSAKEKSEQKQPAEKSVQTRQSQPKRKRKKGGRKKTVTEQADEAVLQKYAKGTKQRSAGDSPLRYKARPVQTGSSGESGIYVKNNKENTQPSVSISDVSVKVRLKFAIRSSAGNSIIAVSRESVGQIPEGALFYGRASFSNHRSYVNFSSVKINGGKYDITGYAVSGKDPGISSEVKKIRDNASIAFKAGVVDAAGKVVENVVSEATGGHAAGVVSQSIGEKKRDVEKEKAHYEYYVPPGTPFVLYIE